MGTNATGQAYLISDQLFFRLLTSLSPAVDLPCRSCLANFLFGLLFLRTGREAVRPALLFFLEGFQPVTEGYGLLGSCTPNYHQNNLRFFLLLPNREK